MLPSSKSSMTTSSLTTSLLFPSVARNRSEPNDSAYLLPRSASNKNFATCIAVDFARARKRVRAATVAREPRGPAARLARAVEWQRQLDAGEVASRAQIARREGLSRARVTQITRAVTRLPRRATLSA
jgi:hypothetical protein